MLAIAGLIFLMVFIALPALQRSQRDTQRRNDMSRLSTAINQYQTNNNGKLPADGNLEAADEDLTIPDCNASNKDGAKCLIANYMNSVNAVENEFVDPDGWRYGVKIIGYGAVDTTKPASSFDHVVYIIKGAGCDGESVAKSNNSRDYAIMYKLEGSGTYCHDNGSGAASSNPSGATEGESGE